MPSSAGHSIGLKGLRVELYLLEPVSFDVTHEIIREYIHLQFKEMGKLPPRGKLIPLSLGHTPCLMKVVDKKPANARYLPPSAGPGDYLQLDVKKISINADAMAWDYRPMKVEPIWADRNQKRNADMLKAYLTEPDIPRPSALVLLEGPPGTGKSMMLDYVLSSLVPEYRIMKPGNLSRMYIGETAVTILDLARTAVSSAPSVIILEEADSVMMSRWMHQEYGGNSTRHHVEETVTALLQAVDMLSAGKNAFMVATTNLDVEESMDPALVSRVGLRLRFREPSADTVETVTRQVCQREGVDFDRAMSVMADVTGGRSPSYRDIHNAIGRVRLMEKAGVDFGPVDRNRKRRKLNYIQ